jgi:uncharacterized protein (TIGR02594 family)
MTPFEIAKSYLGLKELPGNGANTVIIDMYHKAGHPEVKSDEVSWCAAFVGACLVDAEIKPSGSLAARSYLKWGTITHIEEAQPGDIVVFWRNKRTGWQGHVGFYAGQTAKTVKVLGGNQGDTVSYAFYPKDRLLGVRRAPGAAPPPRRPAPVPPVATPRPPATTVAAPTTPPSRTPPVATPVWSQFLDWVLSYLKGKNK